MKFKPPRVKIKWPDVDVYLENLRLARKQEIEQHERKMRQLDALEKELQAVR